MRVLIIEDEKKTAGFIRKGLQEAGYVVEAAESASAGLTMSANSDRYELMVPATGQVQYTGPSTFRSGSGASQYCGASHVVRACNVAGCSAWSAPVTQTLVMGTGGAGAYSVIEEGTAGEGASDE